jgi:TonB-linked SusC/RagA family outer membrane protein
MANVYGEVKFTPWLKYRVNFGSGFRYQRNGAFQGSQSTLRRPVTATATPGLALATYSTNDNFQYMLENLLYFDKTLGVHTFGITVLQSIQDNRTENSYINSSKIIYDTPKWYNQNANLNGNPDSYGTGFTENSLMSYMGRLNYSLLNRYLLTVTGRYDGASVLAPAHKWDFFPSFNVAWKMQEESFLKTISWINELKIRAGYGVVGNSSIGAYTTAGPLSQYSYVFNNGSADVPAIGYNPYNMPNPELHWERTKQVNLGLDFGFLKNRVNGSVEFYQSNTTDNLMDQSIPAITGYPTITANIGEVRNRGIEITASTVNVQTNDFSWSTDFNYTRNKEEIVSLVNGKQDMPGNGWYIGQPIQDMRPFRQYKVKGLWQDTPEDQSEIAAWKANGYTFAPGQYRPIERVVNYQLTDSDKFILGRPRPKWVAGITNRFNYKNFELSFFVYFKIGQSYFSSLQPGGSTGGQFVGNVRHMDPDNFWSPTNTEAEYPQPTTKTTTINGDVLRSTYVNDGSFAIVRNISLSYTIPVKFLNMLKMKSFQIYGQVLNPFIFGGKVVKAGINPDDPTGWTSVNSVGDPTGGANNNTVIIRSWVMGIRAAF